MRWYFVSALHKSKKSVEYIKGYNRVWQGTVIRLEMKVAGGDDSQKLHKLAGAIAKCIRGGDDCILLPVAAPAVNNAVKAVAIASRFFARPLWLCVVKLSPVVIDGRPNTLTRLQVIEPDPSYREIIEARGVEQFRIDTLPEGGTIKGLILSSLRPSCKAIDLSCLEVETVYEAVKAIYRASERLQLRIFPTFEDIEVDGEPQAKVVLRVCAIG